MTHRAWPTIAVGLALLLTLTGSALANDDTSNNADDEVPVAGQITVTESEVIDVAPDELWSTVRDFDALSLWHPAVEGSEVIEGENDQAGAKRRLTLADGSNIDEKLIAYDDDGMRYSYRMVAGALPVANYRATIAVEPEGNESARLVWKGNFDAAEGHSPEEVRQVITHFYRAGLDNVKTMMGGRD